MGVIDHYLCAIGESELMAAEALGDHVVEIMAELSEALLVSHALVCGRLHGFLPGTVQTVAGEFLVLQVEVVELVALAVDAARPLVVIVAGEESRPYLPAVVEALLHGHDVAVLGGDVLTDALAARREGTVFVHIEEEELAGQTVDVERHHAEGGLCLGSSQHQGKKNDGYANAFHNVNPIFI